MCSPFLVPFHPSVIADRCFSPAVKQVPERVYRVSEEHTGPAEFHDSPDPGPHIRPVAMDRTLGANGLSFTEQTPLQHLLRIFVQLPALRTHIPSSMMATAIVLYHECHRGSFTLGPALHIYMIPEIRTNAKTMEDLTTPAAFRCNFL